MAWNALRAWWRDRVLIPPGPDDSDPGSTLNEAGKQANALTLTFLASVIYIAITAASTTDVQLLLNAPLTLPLFGIGVPVTQFYRLAPFIVVFLHLNIFLFEYLIALRLYRLPKAVRLDSDKVGKLYILPSITMRMPGLQHPFVTFLLRLVFLATTVGLPVSVLGLLQIKFMPYQDLGANRLLCCLLIGDILLAWIFFGFRPRPTVPRLAGRQRLKRWIGTAVMGVVSLAIILESSSLVALPPADCGNLGRFHNTLVLRGRILTLHEPPPELIAAYEKTDGDALEKVWLRFSIGVSLSSRNLRCADFSGSQLVNADFRGADLRGAKFVASNLVGAKFSSLGALYPGGGEGLTPANLEGADLSDANLREAKLCFVNLRAAHLEHADVRMSDLSSANLDQVSAMEARFFGADLRSASLRGARMQGANLQGASLRQVFAEFASFIGASLDGVDFSGMKAEGADFRMASLQRALGLALVGIDLRQANVAEASFCKIGPDFTDLRDVRSDASLGDMNALLHELSVGLSEEAGSDVRAMLEGKEPAAGKAVCEGFPSAALLELAEAVNQDPDSTVLYSFVEETGSVRKGSAGHEEEFAEERAAFLVRVACQRGKSVQDALVRTARERLLVDPTDSGSRVLVRKLAGELRFPACPEAFALDSEPRSWVLNEDLSFQ